MLITFDKICLVLTYNAESPTARRRTVTKRVVETRHGTSLHLRDADASIAAPARPNNKDKKTTIVCLYPNIFVPLRGFYLKSKTVNNQPIKNLQSSYGRKKIYDL